MACSTAPRVLGVPALREGSAEQVVRIRCALDGTEVFTTWNGKVYAYAAGEAPRLLFGVVGMNVARCLREGARYRLTSRELMLYLDPDSGRPLAHWKNPWTGEEVPVVHVANALVQMPIGAAPVHTDAELVTVSIDVPLFYPNALATDEATRRFSPSPNYQAGEFFSLVANRGEAEDVNRSTVSHLRFSWFRVSPWLPWMAMGDRPGYLVVSARGQKVDYAALPPVLRDEIAQRVPLFRHAPTCVVAARNESSWTYFAKHLDAFRARERFPIAAPVQIETCEKR